MSVFDDDRADVAGKLTAAGVANVTVDPRVGPPCVFVGLHEGVRAEGVGGWSCELEVQILGVPPGGIDSEAWMSTQLETVLVTLGFSPWRNRTVIRNETETPVKSVPYVRQVPNPNC